MGAEKMQMAHCRLDHMQCITHSERAQQAARLIPWRCSSTGRSLKQPYSSEQVPEKMCLAFTAAGFTTSTSPMECDDENAGLCAVLQAKAFCVPGERGGGGGTCEDVVGLLQAVVCSQLGHEELGDLVSFLWPLPQDMLQQEAVVQADT